MEKKLTFVKINIGADPEFFFQKNGEVYGAEKVLPEEGLPAGGAFDSCGKIIIDGVQAEINPAPSSCRIIFGGNIRDCFIKVKKTMQEKDTDLKATFAQCVNVKQEELDSLKDSSRVFGCAPSNNIYTKDVSKIKVNPAKYLYRSAGGHIHIGLDKLSISGYIKDIRSTITPQRLVPVLDLIVGNTCVLIDRDSGNIERRKVYGRAGEFRTPSHGIEYRTLSNFWLTSYPLMSLVTGLARLGVSIVYSDLDKELLSLVKPARVQRAINTNSLSLAQENFRRIKKFILTHVINESDNTRGDNQYPIHSKNIEQFEWFAEMVQKNGLTHFFKDDPITHWTSNNATLRGWESFLDMAATRERNKISRRLQRVMAKPKA